METNHSREGYGIGFRNGNGKGHTLRATSFPQGSNETQQPTMKALSNEDSRVKGASEKASAYFTNSSDEQDVAHQIGFTAEIP